MFFFKRRRKRRPKLGDRPYRDWHDNFALAVETLGFAAVVVTIIMTLISNAGSEREMSKAISAMSSIAAAMREEKPLIERQAAAATDAARAAGLSASAAINQSKDFARQTDEMSRQTGAMVRGAEATVIATGAQLKAAESILIAQRPAARLIEVKVQGWDSKPDERGQISIEVSYKFGNTGNVYISPGVCSFHLAKNLSDGPSEHGAAICGDNEIQIRPGGTWQKLEPTTFAIPKTDIDDMNAGRTHLYVYGRASFHDNAGKAYQSCFAYRLANYASGGPADLYKAGGAAFQC